MKKLLILLLLSTSLSTFAEEVIAFVPVNQSDLKSFDFTLSDFCYEQPDVQDREGVLYFPNEEVGITATSICVYKDAYGQYESKGDLRNGKKDGKWTHWNQNGETMGENYYIDGETGTIACLDFFTQNEIALNGEPFTGLNICKHDNDQMMWSGNVIDGKKHGRFTLWYENGQKLLETNYKDGKQDGKWTAWHENGQKAGEGHYKDDKPEGKLTSWHENGQKASEAHYKDGVENGKFTDWYENGQKSWERTIKDGWFDGIVTKWDESGQIISEKLYANEKCISGC